MERGISHCDDQIIACAVAGEADVIVSGDRDLLVLEQVCGIPILPPATVLEMLETGVRANHLL